MMSFKSFARSFFVTILVLFLAVSVVRPESLPIYVFTGESAGDRFGWVASAGDVNNDGYPDLIVGAVHSDAAGLDAGRAYVFSGLNGDTLYVFTGKTAGDLLGSSVASAGDVNNDGYADLIVGAEGSSIAGSDAGRAYVFSGLNGDTLHVFNGDAAGDLFGWSVSSAGDVNNDGYDDLIVGALMNDVGGLNAGRAYVFSGLNGDTLYVFTGESAGDSFGRSVASAGDINNDNYADLIVGSISGKAYVFSGLNGDTLYVLTGESSGDMFGFPAALAGDVNNDGYVDLIVGATLNNAGGNAAGRAYVFSGQTGEVLHVFTGEAAGDVFGYSVASAGDVNNDGYADLIVGASHNDAAGTIAGRVYVFSGLNGDTLNVFTGEAAFDRFGRSVASAGDINGDGFADMIVGAYMNDGAGVDAGRVYVYLGAADPVCCVGVTGNVDSDVGEIVDIGDLTTLIGFLFIPPNDQPLCMEEANVDGDTGGIIDIGDLTALIGYLFIPPNDPPAACQ